MIFLILLLAFIVRLVGINQSLWLDEAAQALMSRGNLYDLWTQNADFHPSLFHSLLHFWMKISSNEVFMRLLPVCFGVLSIWVVYSFCQKIFGEKIARISAYLLAVSPFAVWYSQELRGYSLLVLMSLLSVEMFYEKKWKKYTIVNVLGFFTNYMYVFVIFSEFIFLLLRKNNKDLIKFFKSQILLALAFLFFMPEFLLQIKTASLLTTTLPEWRNLSSPNFLIAIPLTIFKFTAGKIAMSGNFLMIFYAAVVVLTIGYILLKNYLTKSKETMFITVMVFVPLLSAWAVSFFIPINNPPRLIFILPFILISIALFVEKFNDKHLIYIFTIISFFGIFMQNYIPKNQKEDWRGAVDFINKNTVSKKQTLVVFEFGGPFAPWQWYEKNGIDAVGVVPAKANEKDLSIYLSPALPGKKTIYLFEYFADVTDPNRLVRKYLEVRQFKVTNYYEFNNLGFVYEMRRPRLF